MTKLELQQKNTALASENAALRSRISELEGEAQRLRLQLQRSTEARRDDVDFLARCAAAREEAMRSGKTVRVTAA